MRRRLVQHLSLVLGTALGLTGCPHKVEYGAPPGPPPPVEYGPPPIVAPADLVAPIVQVRENFARVQFETDSAVLTDASAVVLGENAELLRCYPDLRVEILGHADERGTTDYNMALGQQRATSIEDALVRMGVSSDRLTVLSYGEECPLVEGSGEVVWSQNRRAEFRVLSGGGGNVGDSTGR